jgi:hypothetical protein
VVGAAGVRGLIDWCFPSDWHGVATRNVVRTGDPRMFHVVSTPASRLCALGIILSLCTIAVPGAAQSSLAARLFDGLLDSPYAEVVDEFDGEVRAHLIGLGRINKFRGAWNPEEVLRVTGTLRSLTVRATAGASSQSLFEGLQETLEGMDGASLLFACEARACGPSVQWANLVFEQRILYGTENSQRYRVYSLGDEGQGSTLALFYASARTSDRQYLHIELIERGD